MKVRPFGNGVVTLSFTDVGKSCPSHEFLMSFTVMSPNIARPLTLRTSPSDYATFNQIKSFLIFNISLLLEREHSKRFSLMFSRLSRGGFQQKLANIVKNCLTLISNAPGFKLSILNQVIDEVNC